MTRPHYQQIADIEHELRRFPQAYLTPRRPHWIGWAVIVGGVFWISIFAWVLA